MNDSFKRQTHRILVIDDNPAIHDDFRKVLCPETRPAAALRQAADTLFGRVPSVEQHTHYEIDAVLRGQDGVELLCRATDETRPYSLAFVDMRMPNGWNGLETARRIWQIDPQLDIVLCTAYSDFSWSQIRDQLPQQDRFFILKKPFDNIEVQQLAESVIARRWIETELRESEGNLGRSEAMTGIGHFFFNPDSGGWRVTESLCEMFGVEPGAHADLESWLSLIDAPDRLTLYAAIKDSGRTQQAFHQVCKVLRPADGGTRWMDVRGQWEFSQTGHPKRLIGTFQDITQARAAESQWRLLHAGVAHIDDGLMITEALKEPGGGYRILFVNDAIVALTGYSRDELLGRDPRMLQGPKTSRSELDRIARALHLGTAVRSQLLNYKRNAAEFWVELSINPVADTEGRITQYVAIQRDITSRVQAQAQAIQLRQDTELLTARNLEAMVVLAGGVAHDFNNILAAIPGNGEIARFDRNLPGMRAWLGEIERSARQARQLVEGLLMISRRKPLQAIASDTIGMPPVTAPPNATHNADLPSTDL